MLAPLLFLLLADPKAAARDIFQQLIEINTTESTGSTTKAAEAMAARFRAAGFPQTDIHVAGPDPRKSNIVIRFRGTNQAKKAILFLAHLDVVEARREDWTIDPFRFIEKDGYFYGRGTSDNKQGAAILVADFIRLKQEGYRPPRDLILALTADEEGGEANGVDYLIDRHRDWIEAEFCINTDSGDGKLKAGKHFLQSMQAGEKTYTTFHLETKNPGGHSSLPLRENAIYDLAEALTRIAKLDFPVRLTELTREYFLRSAKLETGQTAADMAAVAHTPPDLEAAERLSAQSPYYNAMLRTTCVATMLEAGHAENALPQTARATINCRVIPEESSASVKAALAKAIANLKVTVTQVTPDRPNPISPLRKDVVSTVEKTVQSMWPGVPVIPFMETGATDGRRLRIGGIPTYGIAGVYEDPNDIRAHGKDERLGVQSFFEGVEFYYRFIRSLAQL